MVDDMGGVLVVASSVLPVMLGRNGQGAEDGRGYRQEESKGEEETVRRIKWRGASAIGQEVGNLASQP
jgi:hypothetical protein